MKNISPTAYSSANCARQSPRMSSSTSACVCTNTSRAPGAAEASSSATRALRYFCCVDVTTSTSQCGSRCRRRSRFVPAACASSVVSGSGQSNSTTSRSSGESRCTTCTLAGSIPSNSGVMSPRQMRIGCRVVGRCRPASVTSPPTRAFTSVLLPVPVPPSVATTRGASSRMRSASARWVSRLHECLALACRRPLGRVVAPVDKLPHQGVHFGQQFQVCRLGQFHALCCGTNSARTPARRRNVCGLRCCQSYCAGSNKSIRTGEPGLSARAPQV